MVATSPAKAGTLEEFEAALLASAPYRHGLAKTAECQAIQERNTRARSLAAMKIPPCHCVPMSERVDKVYTRPPPGFTCGNGFFYDKGCHGG
jgi:hypothetical protein